MTGGWVQLDAVRVERVVLLKSCKYCLLDQTLSIMAVSRSFYLSPKHLSRALSTISPNQNELFQRAAKAIWEADALYITAGAGMGVDSGLPDV